MPIPLWVLESMGMSDPKSKKENNEAVPKQSTETSIVSDIEKALNFLDSEEYQEKPQPVSHKDPSPSRVDPVQSPRPTTGAPTKPQHHISSNNQKIEHPPLKNPSAAPTPTGAKQASGKRWVLYLGGIMLILLAIFMVYKMA